MSRAVIHTDGGSRGNPGPAGIGFTIEVDGTVVCRGGAYIGETTNNVAEYSALVWALENARSMGISAVDVRADSELLVKQIKGIYRVKNEGLKPLFADTMSLLKSFSTFTVTHVRREFNKAADALANEAMDARGLIGDYLCEPGADAPATLF